MSAVLLVLAAGLLVALPAPAVAGGAVVVGPADVFSAAYPTLAREDFEGSRVAAGTVGDCGVAALSSSSESPCYDAGALTRGVTYTSDPTHLGAFNTAVGTAGWFGAASTVVLSNHTPATLVLDFTVPVDTFGFALGMLSPGSCTVEVVYVDRSPSTTLSTTCPAVDSLTFMGVRADRLVDAVRITGSSAEVVDDVRFGLRAPSSVRLGAVRGNRATGGAVLRATVPGIGTTTLGGNGVVPVSQDSARPRTLALPVAARGAARRTLLRTGRVAVTVRVTYRPNGGTPTTVTKRVTLRKRMRAQQ
ncbi:hypothetical protein [Nocardioides sp. 1609]|uniref:hypothetical protein n=1 Tax=Nocardioides sp. 1609 TaxID=2508327 RepID=UPI00106F0C79|nr:hypothetical protein [Nocardioides sp. 1609]